MTHSRPNPWEVPHAHRARLGKQGSGHVWAAGTQWEALVAPGDLGGTTTRQGRLSGNPAGGEGLRRAAGCGHRGLGRGRARKTSRGGGVGPVFSPREAWVELADPRLRAWRRKSRTRRTGVTQGRPRGATACCPEERLPGRVPRSCGPKRPRDSPAAGSAPQA